MVYLQENAPAALNHSQALPALLNPTEQMLTERFARRRRVVPEIVCEFTRDPALLHQYYMLRGPLIARTFGWKHFDGSEDEYDRKSHVLVVRRGNHVVGGARIIVRSPRNNSPLLLETQDFSLIDQLPELRLGEATYCEISRLAILEEFQNSPIIYLIFDRLWQKCRAINATYTFATVTPGGVRLYRKVCSDLGMDTFWIQHAQLPRKPHYEGVDMKLYAMKMRPNETGIGRYAVWNEQNTPHEMFPLSSAMASRPHALVAN